MLHAYTEDQLVEHPAIGWLAELVWTIVSVLQNLRRTRDLLLPRLLSGQVKLVLDGEIATLAAKDNRH